MTENANGVGFGAFGPDHRLRAHTGGIARLLGLPGESLAHGRDLMCLLGELTGETAPALPCSLQHRTGDDRLLALSVAPLSDGGWALQVADITGVRATSKAQQDARDAAVASALARARFLTTMNHELRTPLNAVIGFAETLAQDAVRPGHRADPKETEEFALHILNAGRHLLTLIDDLLDLVRLDAGSYELAADTVDVAYLVQSAVRGAKEAAGKADLTLTGRDNTGAVRLRADERRLRRLLGHLLSNAIRVTPISGSVSVTAAPDVAGGVRIEVRDTGVGMAAADIERVLSPIDRLDTRLARRSGGAGFGLRLSRAIAEAHGGALLIDSAPGRGTVATLLLPRERLLASSPSLQLAQEPP